MLRDTLDRVVGTVTGRSRLTLLVMVLVSAVVLAGVPQLDTESSASTGPEAFEDLDRVQAAQYVGDRYGANESRPAVHEVYVSDPDGNVLSKSSLLSGLRYQQTIRENDSLAGLRQGEGPTGLANLVATRLAGEETDLAGQVRALESASPAAVERAVATTVADDPRASRFLPADHDPGSTTATDRRLVVRTAGDADPAAESRATAALYAAANDRANVFTLGEHAAADYNAHFLGEMLWLVVPVALLVVLVVLSVAYRDLVDVLVGMTGVGLCVAWMFGIMGWLGVAAGTISIVPVVLVTGLSIDFGFHVFNRYREQRGPEDAIRPSMRRGVGLVATALVLVTVTAAIGFLSNLVNPLAVVRNLGVSITLGVVSALVVFTTVVPALKVEIDGALERFGIDRHERPLGHGRYLERALGASVVAARRGAPAVVVLAVVAGAAGGVAWTDLDREQFGGGSAAEVAEWKQSIPDPVGWEPGDYVRRSERVDDVYRPAGGGDTVRSRILVRGDVTGDDALADLRAGVDRLRADGVVLSTAGDVGVRSPLTAMERVAQRDPSFATAFERADTDGDGVPDEDLASLYDALYAADADAAGRVVERTDGEYRSLLVTVPLSSNDWTDRAAYVADLERGADRIAEDGRTATLAGNWAVSAAVLDELTGGILLTMVVGLTAIVVATGAAFRLMHGSLALGVVVAGPIVLVVGLVVGGMYALSIPLNLLTALLMSLVIGLGVDYNVHVGDRFADERRAGASLESALRAAVTGTGGALFGSTLTSAGAFAALWLVPNGALQSFAAIVVVALVTAFVVSVAVLPSALALFHRLAPDAVALDASVDPAAGD
jgi:predicted RND superfamily exporter protein